MAKLKHKTKKEVDKEKEEKEKQRVLSKRQDKYGSANNQLENILEDVNKGVDPMKAIKREAERVRKIKENNPK